MLEKLKVVTILLTVICSSECATSEPPEINVGATEPTPHCDYEILSSLDGPPVTSVKVGDRVYHRWQCKVAQGLFCMTLHSCSASNGNSSYPLRVSLLDENGCSIDSIIMPNANYPDDTTALIQTEVAGFHSDAVVDFSCEIRLSLKEDDVCKRSSDNCKTSIKGGRRVKRRFSRRSSDPEINLKVDYVLHVVVE